MSMMIYGAARLVDDHCESQAEVLRYWQQLEEIHFVHLIPHKPTDEYLQDRFRGLWDSRDWIRFSLVGIADGKSGSADHLLLQAALQAQKILKKQHTLTSEQVWTRVSQWRFLYFMFWHGLLTDGFLVVENASGDMVEADDEKQAPLTSVLSDLWVRYCWDMSCEDATLYRFDLSLLPR